MACIYSKEKEKLVSIIVPVYNCEDYIERCILSIINQSYSEIEILIVDDGSTDGSGEIIDSFTDERIIIIHQENRGVCIARNNALERSTGEYIIFIDGDDYVEKDYIERMVTAAQLKDSEIVISGFMMEHVDGKNINVISPKSYRRFDDEMWAYRLSAACGRLYKRTLWEKYDIRYTLQKGVRGEDVPICLLTNYVAKNIITLDYAGYHYVQHEGSAMAQFRGLKKYGFPYEAMTEISVKIGGATEHNGKDFFDVGILKLYAQFYYDLGRGAEKTVKREMLKFFCEYIKNNCPDYKVSWKSVKKKSELPITIKMAIELFVIKVGYYTRKTGI